MSQGGGGGLESCLPLGGGLIFSGGWYPSALYGEIWNMRNIRTSW